MKCPYCNYNETKVLDKRDDDITGVTRRRRECESCKKRFTSYERPELLDLVVLKKDGTKESFDRTKIMHGLRLATRKRGISERQLSCIVNEIEGELRQRDSVFIPSIEIGNLIMDKLKRVDNVAYIRFASVYRSFADPEDFRKEVMRLIPAKQ